MNVFRTALITCLVVSVVVPVSSQNRVIWEAYVQPERIAVYDSNSTESSITGTLIRGDIVDVIFEVNASGTDWCRVSREGSQPLGFVLCLNLGKVPSVSKQSHRAAPGEVAPVVATRLASESTASSAVLTNKDILEMRKAGLPEQVLVAKIKSSQCDFDTSPGELSRLKSAGVADGVILAMVEAPAAKEHRQSDAGDSPTQVVHFRDASDPAALKRTGIPGALPTEPGMYVEGESGYTKILGQIVEFERTGSLLVSHVTLGLKSAKSNAQLLGAHAATVVPASPTFYFVPAKQEGDAGVNAGDLILIRLEEKPERRQFEVEAVGDMRASKGITLTHQVQLDRSEIAPGVFKIVPIGELGRGEYGLYLARGEGLAPYIYDFSIQ
jgi:hypothetical protein